MTTTTDRTVKGGAKGKVTTTEQWVPVEPLTDAQEQRRYWTDPKIGDRVRVRLSGECTALGKRQHADGSIDVGGHIEATNGRVGVVGRCPLTICGCHTGNNGGHNVVVRMIRLSDGTLVGGHYAPSELEPA